MHFTKEDFEARRVFKANGAANPGASKTKVVVLVATTSAGQKFIDDTAKMGGTKLTVCQVEKTPGAKKVYAFRFKSQSAALTEMRNLNAVVQGGKQADKDLGEVEQVH